MSNTFIQRKKWNQFTTSLIWNKSSMTGSSLKSRPCSQMVFNDKFVLCSCVSNRYDECENQNQTLDLHNKEWVIQSGKGHVTGCPTPDQIRILLILLILRPTVHRPQCLLFRILNFMILHSSSLYSCCHYRYIWSTTLPWGHPEPVQAKSYIPYIYQFWYTNAPYRPVKGTLKIA